MITMNPRIGCIISMATFLFLTSGALAQTAATRMDITVLDHATGKPVPCRIHLKDSAAKPIRAGHLPFFRDHFVCPGTVQLELPPGRYSYEIERGPEYLMRIGSFSVVDATSQSLSVELERLVDLSAEGWWSGETHVHRPVEDVELLMRAEDLHVAPVMTWWNNQNLWKDKARPEQVLVRFDQNRFYHVMGGEDEREGGALLFFNLSEPLSITGSSREYPSPMKFLTAGKQKGAWIDIEKPFWWDVPIWLASGQVNSIGLANNHMCRDQMYVSEAWGRPRDAQRLPSPRGNGFWTQEIYYHILNCGLRIPPSAGSASGVLPNPVGYNRVYVHLGNSLNYEHWWEGLRAGRSFVSNGPLLRCQANGQGPGHVFSSPGKELSIDLNASLDSRDPISVIEIIKNGAVERAVPFDDWKKTRKLGSIQFSESGWFLVRVVADNPNTFRFASTAPFFVEIGEAKRRISKASAQFFLDWIRERTLRVKLDDAEQRSEVLKHHQMAEEFWQDQLAKANAP
jgi:hypothetical protein